MSSKPERFTVKPPLGGIVILFLAFQRDVCASVCIYMNVCMFVCVCVCVCVVFYDVGEKWVILLLCKCPLNSVVALLF